MRPRAFAWRAAPHGRIECLAAALAPPKDDVPQATKDAVLPIIDVE